ncbi:hypothetical protein AC244_02225 [Ensifer adhaerens]|uniref:sn-glycerol-3-phosphate-binding periplasmic protein UgpB n=1 Tax=Ensifer adhaerens TaxID=106592 RepID=A0A0L8C6F7_ENSAD|nr:extracellular solute-binding protein [Ensifer adhaerens]KOF22374.1 hypothetical protein AC244_02225 [Ensifer adhaerens]
MKSIISAIVATTVLVSTASAQEDKVFRVWWFEDQGNAADLAWSKALDEFKSKHPDVEVHFERKSWDQLVTAGTMVLNSDSTPDLLEYPGGNASTGLAASSGLLEDLDPVAEERGWTKALNPAQLMFGRYDERGLFGSGPLVGIPNGAEFVTVFYNKDMFAQNGIEVPKTFEDFEKVLDAFAQNGVTPIATAANDYPALHVWYELALAKSDRKWLDQFHGLKAPLDSTPFLEASKKLQDWVTKGYISKDSTGLTASDMVGLFEAGKSPMVVTGTWYATEFNTKITTFKWGQFLFPGNTIHPASTGGLWVVPKTAKNKTLAYDFIDITLSNENQKALADGGGVALIAKAEDISNPTGAELTKTASDIVAANGLGYYPDQPFPGYYEIIRTKVQALVGGTISPEDAVDEMKQAYDDAQSDAH